MPIFLMTLLRSVHFYIYVALLSVIGTLYFMNGRHVHTIEKQAEEIVQKENARRKLENALTNQNERVRVLMDEKKALEARVENGILIIETLDEEGNKVLMELDEQAIPKEHRGALMWLIQKSMEELRQ